MGRLFFKTLLLIGLGWILGDRFGTPEFITAPLEPTLASMEARVGLTPKEVGFTSKDYVLEAAVDETAKTAPQPVPSSASAPTGGLPENEGLQINEAGLDIIKRSEGLRLEAYSSGGRSYIGYGHQMQPGEPSTITEAQATALLRQDVRVAEHGVKKLITRPMNENQFSAMVSLAYNLGNGNFSRSQVVSKFNAGDIQGAANAFLNHNKAGGQVLDHLTHRREEERALFLTPA